MNREWEMNVGTSISDYMKRLVEDTKRRKKTMDKPERLYGPPGSENLYLSIVEVYESYYDGREDLEAGARLEIEEWTVVDARSLLWDAEDAVVELVTWVSDGGEVTEDWYDRAMDAARHPDVIKAFDQAIDLLASKISYWMADKVVGSHWVTMEEGEVLVNGEPLYEKRTDQ